MAFTVTLKNLGAFAAASNLQLFLYKTSDNSLLNTGGDTGGDASSIGSFAWSVAEDRPAEQMLAKIYEGATATAANIVIDSVLNVGFTEIGQEAVELDSAATAALVDLIWDEPLTGATHNVATSSGKRLRQTTAFQQIDATVIDAAATTTTFVTGLTSSVDDFYNDSMLVFTDGALAGQVRAIYDYIGATKTIILEEALTSAPVNGVAFAIVSLHIHPVSQIQSGLATAAELVTLRGADNDTLKTLSDQIDTVSADVSSIASVSREAF